MKSLIEKSNVFRFFQLTLFFYLSSCGSYNSQYDVFRNRYHYLNDAFYSGNDYHIISPIGSSWMDYRLLSFLYPDYDNFLKYKQNLEGVYDKYNLVYKNRVAKYKPTMFIAPEENLTLIWFSTIYLYSKIPNEYGSVEFYKNLKN